MSVHDRKRLLYRAPIDDSTLLTVLDGILDLITLVEEYDPDEHDPIQFIGALLLILAARTADASYNSEAIDIVLDHLVEEAITDEEEEEEDEEEEDSVGTGSGLRQLLPDDGTGGRTAGSGLRDGGSLSGVRWRVRWRMRTRPKRRHPRMTLTRRTVPLTNLKETVEV